MRKFMKEMDIIGIAIILSVVMIGAGIVFFATTSVKAESTPQAQYFVQVSGINGQYALKNYSVRDGVLSGTLTGGRHIEVGGTWVLTSQEVLEKP